jgi:hypothetical protein
VGAFKAKTERLDKFTGPETAGQAKKSGAFKNNQKKQ